jgi:hypothetical protein
MIQGLLSPAKALRTLRKTPLLLADSLGGVTQEQARTLRDGDDGWSILFIVCHLRDYEVAVGERVEAMLEGECPTFASLDNEDLARRGRYEARTMTAVLADLEARRAALVERLAGLTGEQWARRGLHPRQGPATVLEVAINAGLHDIDHLEQVARCRAGRRPGVEAT